jgi:hypothetical protein
VALRNGELGGIDNQLGEKINLGSSLF